jgi:hypothetical protein
MRTMLITLLLHFRKTGCLSRRMPTSCVSGLRTVLVVFGRAMQIVPCMSSVCGGKNADSEFENTRYEPLTGSSLPRTRGRDVSLRALLCERLPSLAFLVERCKLTPDSDDRRTAHSQSANRRAATYDQCQPLSFKSRPDPRSSRSSLTVFRGRGQRGMTATSMRPRERITDHCPAGTAGWERYSQMQTFPSRPQLASSSPFLASIVTPPS